MKKWENVLKLHTVWLFFMLTYFFPVFPCMYVMHIKISICWMFMKIFIKI